MTTTTRKRVTKAEATKTLNAVKRMFKAYIDGNNGPTLIKDWEWGWTTINRYDWAIVWEEGPFEWTYRFPGGGFDEEMFHLAREFGDDHARRLATRPGVELPEGVWTEAITSWATAIHPKDW